MTYMISSFARSASKMAFIQATSQTFATSAGTYQVDFGSVSQSDGFNLSISGGTIALPAGDYVAFFKGDCRNQGSANNSLSYTMHLKLGSAIVSQLSYISEGGTGSTSLDSIVAMGGSKFTSSQGDVLSLSLVKNTTSVLVETFPTYTGIALIKV